MEEGGGERCTDSHTGKTTYTREQRVHTQRRLEKGTVYLNETTFFLSTSSKK
jgi:hypothetical protein